MQNISKMFMKTQTVSACAFLIYQKKCLTFKIFSRTSSFWPKFSGGISLTCINYGSLFLFVKGFDYSLCLNVILHHFHSCFNISFRPFLVTSIYVLHVFLSTGCFLGKLLLTLKVLHRLKQALFTILSRWSSHCSLLSCKHSFMLFSLSLVISSLANILSSDVIYPFYHPCIILHW